MPFYVYIIGSNEPRKRTYVGWTTDINKRLKAHNTSKGAKFTRGRVWKLMYYEKYQYIYVDGSTENQVVNQWFSDYNNNKVKNI